MAALSARAAFRRLREGWQRLLGRRRSLPGLAACPPGEQERVAQDVGVSVSDSRTAAAARPGPSRLLQQRLALLGLDPAYVTSALADTYRDLERTCGMCTARRRCARDLARGDVQAGMGRYCLCTPTIDALTVGRAGQAPGMVREPRLPVRQSAPWPPWPMSRRVERRAVRMHEMMRRLDVDAARLARLHGGDAYAEARARCLSCKASGVCLGWLDADSSGGRPEFCPNLTLFEGCRRERVASQ